MSWYVFLSLSLSLNVYTIVQLFYDSLYLHILSLSSYLLSCSLKIRIGIRLYCDSLYVYMYVSWSMFFCFISKCLYGFSSVLSLIVRVLVRLLIRISLHVSLYLSQYSHILPLILRVYVRHFSCLCFPLIFCLSMCIPVSEYIIIHSWCICTSLDPCFCRSFYMIVYVCVRLYCFLSEYFSHCSATL